MAEGSMRAGDPCSALLRLGRMAAGLAWVAAAACTGPAARDPGTAQAPATPVDVSVPAHALPTPREEWALDWQDEFSGPDVNPDNWLVPVNCGYSPDCVNQADGILSLSIQRIAGKLVMGCLSTGTPSGGMPMQPAGWKRSLRMPFRVEYRLSYSGLGSGVVGAVCSFTDWTPVAPGSTDLSCLEIDMTEHRGCLPTQGQYVIHRHLRTPSGQTRETSYTFTPIANRDEWHVYAFEVDHTGARWYIDGKLEFSRELHYTEMYDSWSKPQALTLGLWHGESEYTGPLDPAKLPVAMRFDWIKVYRKR